MQKSDIKTDHLKDIQELDFKTKDEGDLSSAVETLHLNLSLYQHKQNTELNKPKAPFDFDGVHCYDCGEEIPEYRLKTIGDFLCTECREMRNKLKNRK